MSELDPQVKVLLEQFQPNGEQHPSPTIPLSVTEKVVASRQRINAYSALGIASEAVSKVEDFDIPGPAGNIPVRWYIPRPEGPPLTNAPVLVFYHGGGFVSGGLESHDRLLRAIANRGRCVVVSVAYRLAPENPYPAANDDAWASLMWVVEQASEIGADSQRLAVGGDSAGGLLAAWVAQKAAKDGLMLRLQMLLYPNLDATTSKPSWKELGTGAYLVSRTEMMERYDAYLPQGIDRQDPKVSPLFATDLAGLAPAFIVTADHDPLRDEGEEYAARLKAANVGVEYICWPGMVHGFASLAGILDAGRILIDQAGAALRKAFE